jgi:hypothetical protein
MNSPYGDKYLDKLWAGGDLLKQLEAMAKEMSGPCGQSSHTMTASNIRRQALKNAIAEIKKLREEVA